jgi:hypothetical protein
MSAGFFAPPSKAASRASASMFSYAVGAAARVCQTMLATLPGCSIWPLPATLFGAGRSHGTRFGLYERLSIALCSMAGFVGDGGFNRARVLRLALFYL